jgi:hypothetical protein
MNDLCFFRPMGLPLFALELQAQVDPRARAICDLMRRTTSLDKNRAIVREVAVANLMKRIQK